MSSSIHTVLIIGGTSGIGEACARRFHSMSKKVIITGRRQNRLDEIKSSLPGIETYAFDMTDLSALPKHVDKLFTQYPDIDTTWINGGILHTSSIRRLDSSTDEKLIDEVTSNVTAPMLIARHIIPRLVSRNAPATFMITSSGLGFVPVGSMFPTYGPTKAAIHHYMVGLRQALKDTQVNVIEIVPPMVEPTELGMEYKHLFKALKPQPLDEFVEELFKGLEGEGKEIKEIATGTAVSRVEGWRNGIGPLLVQLGG